MSGARKTDAEALAMFRKAVDALLRRMARDNELRFKMLGTQTYAELLDAYAASNGAELPDMPELASVESVWESLHASAVSGKAVAP